MRPINGLIGMIFVCLASAATEVPAGRGVDEIPAALATGPSGAVYVAGLTRGRNRGERIYVAKIEPGGARREYTAYLGSSGEDVVKAIAIDREGNAYIVGSTAAMDAFVAKIDGKGNWQYSTLLGGRGNDAAHGVAVDRSGDVYVTGWTASSDFPADGEKTGEVSAFVVKLRGGKQISGTLFGGGDRTKGNGIAVDLDGATYVAGSVEQSGRSDAFLLKLNGRGEQIYRSVLSGTGDQAAMSVALAEDGAAWIGGWTSSSDFPGVSELGGGRDAFVARFDREGSRTFSKVIGGKADDEAHEVALDINGNVYLGGITRSANFPTLDASEPGSEEARSFAVKLSASGDRVYHSGAVGPVRARGAARMAVDGIGNAILTGGDGEGGSLLKVATCRYKLSQALQSLGTGGGDGSVLVDAPPECGWMPESNSAWITVTRLGDQLEFRVASNHAGPRAGTIAAGGQTLVVVQAGNGDLTRAAITGPIRGNAGFQASSIVACDDCSATSVAQLGFSINFFGTSYSQVYVNNNGNVTFDNSNSTYSPSPISAIRNVIIAPFWADVDTRGTGSGLVRYGQDLVNGRKAFGVNWVDVGYYSSRTDKLNSAQLVLIDRGDQGVGFFDIEFNYASIQWETGNASGGTNGLGGTSARAGFSNGTGTAGTYFELPGSGVNGALLDGGSNSLSFNSSNSSGVGGRYVYNVRAGLVVCGLGVTSTFASVPAAGGPVVVTVTASNATCTWGISQLPSWITVTTAPSAYGTGGGTVTLAVAQNTSPSRSATISIAGQSFTVSQAGTAGPITCPPVTFARAADVQMMSGTTNQGTISGVERNSDGSLTQHTFTGTTANNTQTSTPQFQQTFTSCSGRNPTTPTPPINYRLLAEQRGTAAGNPIFTDLTNTGRSTAVGVNPYSQDPTKLQVWNAAANRTPGPKFSYDVPANPQKIIAADFNNDGKQDILVLSVGVAGSNQGVVSIFLGNGDGTLGTRRDINVGNNPQSATTYDFNGDNKLDIAVVNATSNTMMILNGNGDGTFQAPFTVPDVVTKGQPGTGIKGGTAADESVGPRAVAVADINKDGKPDMVLGHNDGVDIRLGNGNGTFQAAIHLVRGFVATFVATGDLNKDSNADIVVSSSNSATVTVLLGNGNGTFRTPFSYVTREHAGAFFVSDFDWDGNPDVVFAAGHPDALVAASGDTNITVLYGRGDGTLYGTPAVVLPSLGEFTVGNFNNDAVPDVVATAPLVAGTPNATGLYVALNNGAGTLVAQTPISVGGLQLSRIASGDFNGDGKRDVAVTAGNTIQVLTGTGTGTFNAPAALAGGPSMTSITAADVNADNKQDLIFTDDNEDRVSVALGNGNGTFAARTQLVVGVDPKSVVVADVNGDGKPDLIVANSGQLGNDTSAGGISVLLGNGNGTFQSATNFNSGIHPTNVTVGDVNADGKADLIVSTGGANGATNVAIHLGNGNGTFQTPTLIPVAFGPAQTSLSDFNGDGKVDVVVGHCCGDIQMGVLLGNGNGTFQPETNIPNTGNGSSFVAAADMNADSRTDIVFGANGTSGAFVGTLLNVTSTGPVTCSFTVSQATYAPSAVAQSFGGSLTANASSCSFITQTSAAWISVTPFTGAGSTTFTITVQANAGVARTGTVSIGGQTITINQAAPACPYTLSPVTLSPPPAGGSYTINVTSSAGCAWSISGVPFWVTVPSPASLNSAGSGVISVNVAANGGAARIANLTIAGQNFPITQAGAGPAGGLRFTAVPPCRLLETRAEYNFEGRTGVFGPPFFNAGDTRTLPLPSSTVCRTIPATAKAYVLNVTVVPNGGLDFVTVWPAGETRPDFWTVRSPDGLIVANSAVVAAGAGGAISVYASNRTDIIIDISGYFTDDPVVSNLVYYPLTPCRVVETRIDYRTPPGPFGPPTMAAQQPRSFRFPTNGLCPVPAGAAAYAATITVVPPGPLAFLTAWPEGGSQPNVSSMNSPAGRVLANSVIVPASPDGGISLYTFDRSDVIVDITGYFGPDDGSTGMFYFPVRQCRVSQTNGTGFTGAFAGPIFADDSTRTIPIPSSTCVGVPANARAYSLNATVIPGGSPMPFLTIYPTGQGRPNASVINAFEGQTVSSGFLVSAGTNGAVDVYAFRHTHVALEISGYFGR